ncbi:MAG: RluA family pseudouridine synthase [Candidatus Delongbacteria bacterium]|nr:RluA family pseudouridine synthase [Candidatus Delongbacteria bacterium]MBN2835244.1 RluA family pseudouridine synthase [Candidatus Delongbacteria bacterium]
MFDLTKYPTIEEMIIEVPGNKQKERVDKYVQIFLKNVSRNRVQNLALLGMISVNDKVVRSNHQIKPGDRITIKIPRAEKIDITAENIPIDFVYQDKYLAIINKQAGLVVHPTYSSLTGTLVNALMYHFRDELSSINGELRPGIVHRLDKDTTGLMVVAKSDLVHQPLADQFAEKTARREYIGICMGKFAEPSGRIETLLTRWQKDRRVIVTSEFEGKVAITNYEVLKEYNKFSIVKFLLETGRTHQIRAHMKHIGRPLFGDPVYNGTNFRVLNMPKNQEKRFEEMLEILPRQALHARKLELTHPITQKRIQFEADIPPDMLKIIALIEEYDY